MIYYLRDFNKIQLPHDLTMSLVWSILEKQKLGKNIFIIGNGGSAANASHFAEDLAKCGTENMDKRIKVISLTDNNSFITCIANDYGYEFVFVEQLRHLANKGDLLIAISGSGNSLNILKALEYAKYNIGMDTFGFLGMSGGKAKELCDESIIIDSNDMGYIETAHLLIIHGIVKKVNHYLVIKDI